MRRNQKGFTLIELLAVIVILAVIALIATPLIMNVINDAKKGADRDAAYGVIKAIETSAMQKMALDPTYDVPASCTIGSDKTKCGDLTVNYKGTQPEKAVIYFDQDRGSVKQGSYVKMKSGYFVMEASGTFPGEPVATEPSPAP